MSERQLIDAVVAALGVSQSSAWIYVRAVLTAQARAAAQDRDAYLDQLGDA